MIGFDDSLKVKPDQPVNQYKTTTGSKMFGTLVIMESVKKSISAHRKPSIAAVRRAVASSTAVETGQNVQSLEQKLKEPTKRRFTNIKLAI